ncbi:MAG: universal stress protein A [Nitrosomonas sp.]|nr:MAG: universal stress protein A [Nitrosomonas sp.]
MYKKIMVAVDGSETAKQALAEAENIANTYNATLCIVHSIGGDTEADRQKGNEILAQAKTQVQALTVESRLLEAEAEYGLNGITEAIAKAVAEWSADLVVVGTANRRGLERFFVGSVAEQLVSKVDASILLVRPQN